MKNLIKGKAIMKFVSDEDVDMYIKAGWKVQEVKKIKQTKKALSNFEEIPLNADDSNSDTFEE